jgi:hypothetical protein
MNFFKLLIICSLCLFCTSISAQGTALQFNQVKLVSTQETVPAGKVWKVESVLSTSTLAANNNSAASVNTVSLDIQVNGTSITVERSSVGIASQTSSSGVMRAYWGYASAGVTRLPFWLPAGSTLAASTNAMAVSVLEFNVIP